MDDSKQLNITDMFALKALLEALCARGAFKAGEMSGVGHIYDKLASFVDTVSQNQPKASPPQ